MAQRIQILFLLSLLVVFQSLPSSAQQENRHPRVAELEDKLKEDASQFLKTRFPGMPFLISITIDPLRRPTASGVEPVENLPWYLVENEEIRDEWDDPSFSLYALLNRVKRIDVRVDIPEKISDQEVAEIKEAFNKNLRLLPARDQLEIVRKSWQSQDFDYRKYAQLGLISIFAFLVGLFIVHRLSVSKLASSLASLQTTISDRAKPSGDSASLPAPSLSMEGPDRSAGGKSSGDVRLTDPMKIREVVQSRLADLLGSQNFPTLEDMIELDRLAANDPASLGALMAEFPAGDQRRIFSLGRSKTWFQSFAEPGSLTLASLEVLEKVNRVRPRQNSRVWEDLRIQLWRLGDQLGTFLRTLNPDVAISLLASLPRSISLPVGRKVFPGAWAVLLDTQHTPKELSETEIQKILDDAVAMAPRLTYKRLETYKKDQDLLDYLRVASVQEEEDIYTAVGDDSLKALRPPFFPILDSKAEWMEEFVNHVHVKDWAMALFNVSRDRRQTLESFFGSKKKFMFYEYLKQLDRSHPSPQAVGSTREMVARIFEQFKLRDRSAAVTSGDREVENDQAHAA